MSRSDSHNVPLASVLLAAAVAAACREDAVVLTLLVTLTLAGCGSPPSSPLPDTPEGLVRLFDDPPGSTAASYAMEAIRENPWRWSEDDFARLRTELVARAAGTPDDDPALALFVLLEGRGEEGDFFAELPDMVRVYNQSEDPGVRAAIVGAVPARWDGPDAVRFLGTVLKSAGGRDAPAAEAAVLGLAGVGGDACALLRDLLDGREIRDAGAAAMARPLVDDAVPLPPDSPDGCRKRGWVRILGFLD